MASNVLALSFDSTELSARRKPTNSLIGLRRANGSTE